MKTNHIRSKIAEAIAIEQNTHMLANSLAKVAALRTGIVLSTRQREDGVAFIKAYVEYVPMLLDQLDAESKKLRIEQSINPLISQVEYYFFLEEDAIPDRLGLLGLMDDGYIANSVIQKLSEQYQLNGSGALVTHHIAGFNPIMRNLIGEPQASILDGYVQEILSGQEIRVLLEQLQTIADKVPSFTMEHYNHPIWENATTDEIVNTRIGSLGFA